MPINFYPRLSLDGGAAGDLDNLDGATLQVNDIAMVGEGTSASFYIANEDGNGESLPDIVVPDDNPGSWNWVLLNPVVAKLEVALDADSQAITNANLDSGDINSAVQVNITDVGAKITATEVNGALQENRILIDANTSHSGGDGSDHADVADNTTHRGSDGSDHDFLDQDVSIATAPALEGTNITLLPLAGILDADKTGDGDDLVTGAAGDNLDFASWDASGDLAGSGYAASEIGVLATAAEWSGAQNFNEMAILSDTAAVAWDLDVRQCAVHVLTEDTTISEPSNMKGGGTYVLRIMQAVEVWTLDFDAAFKWGAAGKPDAPLGNADVIILSFYSDGTYMHGVEFIREEA